MYSWAGIICIPCRRGVQLIPRDPGPAYNKVDIIVRDPDTIYAPDADKSICAPALTIPKELVVETEFAFSPAPPHNEAMTRLSGPPALPVPKELVVKELVSSSASRTLTRLGEPLAPPILSEVQAEVELQVFCPRPWRWQNNPGLRSYVNFEEHWKRKRCLCPFESWCWCKHLGPIQPNTSGPADLCSLRCWMSCCVASLLLLLACSVGWILMILYSLRKFCCIMLYNWSRPSYKTFPFNETELKARIIG